MPIRWYVCPVDTVQDADPETGQLGEPYRIPRVGRLLNPLTGRRYAFSGAVHTGNWAVVFVTVADEAAFATIAADAQCIDLLEQSYEAQADILALTPADLSWSNARLTRLRNRMEARGVDTTGLTRQTPLAVCLDRLMAAVHPSFRTSGTRAR